MEIEGKQQPRYIKLPPLRQEAEKDFKIVGILDNSGSMHEAWTPMAKRWNKMIDQFAGKITSIIFSSNAKIVDGQINLDACHYENASTNICGAFEMLQVLIESRKETRYTVIFLSDGQDNEVDTLKERMKNLQLKKENVEINFICLGIGDHFPTFVAMDLREKYHRGDASIEPVFLVEHPGEESEYEEQFNLMQKYFNINTRINLGEEPKLKLKEFPWEDFIKEGYANTWVMCTEEMLDLSPYGVQGGPFKSKSEAEMTIKETIDVFRKWVSKLQLMSLKRKVTPEAKTTVEAMKSLADSLEKQMGLDEGTNGQPQKKAISFMQRLQKKYCRKDLLDVATFINAVKKLAEENILNLLSEKEAAQRLAIGTRIGKFHEKALKMRGLTVEIYQDARDELITLLHTTKLTKTTTKQQPSIISLQTQRDVFMEPDLEAALELCESQYDLVENLPVIGHAITVKRVESALIDPWKVEVLSIARHHKVVDSVSIQRNQNHLKLKIGGCDEEYINCVIPLFDKEDEDLRPYLTSKLFHILMTFNVLQNADTLYQDAYLAIIGNTLYHLLKLQEENEWKKGMLNLVASTLRITYSNWPSYKHYTKIMINKPDIGVITEHSSIDTRCEDLCKPLLVAFMYKQSQNCNPEILEKMLDRIIMEYFGRDFPVDTKVSSFYRVKNPEIFDKLDFNARMEEWNQNHRKDAHLNFHSLYQYKKDFLEFMEKVETNIEKDLIIELDSQKFNDKKRKYTLGIWQHIYKWFTGNEFDLKKCDIYLKHASISRSSYTRNTTPVEGDHDKIMRALRSEIFKHELEKRKEKVLDKFWDTLEKEFRRNFSEIHMLTDVITPAELETYCKEHKIDKSVYKYSPGTMLVRNACLCMKCPYFMKPDPWLEMHLDANDLKFTALHKTVASLLHEPPERIWAAVIEGDFYDETRKVNKKVTPEMLNKKEVMIKWIEHLQAIYLKNLQWAE